MRLIVGLGNPGPEYEFTPHNLGFLAIDRLAQDAGIRVDRKEGNALVGPGRIEQQDVLLAKPLSFMNLSGGPIKVLLRKYELTPADLLVIYDDLDLPWGAMRLRKMGSAGTHNGMKSVVASLGSTEFARLRLGAHPGRPYGDGARYVLRPLRRDELDELDGILDRAAKVVRILLSDGAEKAMAAENRRAVGTNQEEA